MVIPIGSHAGDLCELLPPLLISRRCPTSEQTAMRRLPPFQHEDEDDDDDVEDDVSVISKVPFLCSVEI